MVIYEDLKAQAKFSEEGVLLIETKSRDLWVNFLIKDSTVYLFDYHNGHLLKTLAIDEHFDHSKVMSTDLDLYLKSKSDNSQGVHIKARDQGQKLRIGLTLITCYGTKVHGIDEINGKSDEPFEETYYAAGSNISETVKLEPVPDTPLPTSPMSKEDANETIKPGTVRTLQALIGSNIPLSPRQPTSKKPITLAEKRPDPLITNLIKQEEEESSTQHDEPEELPPAEPAPDYMEEESESYVMSRGFQNQNIEIQTNYDPVTEVVNSWHKEDFTRRDAENFVRNKEDGTFVVRNRVGIDSKIFPYALTLAYKKASVHIQIQRIKDHGFVFAPYKPGETTFESLNELIDHYQVNRFYFFYNGKQGHVSLKCYQ